MVSSVMLLQTRFLVFARVCRLEHRRDQQPKRVQSQYLPLAFLALVRLPSSAQLTVRRKKSDSTPASGFAKMALVSQRPAKPVNAKQ